MALLADRVLDNGLSALTSEVNKLTICSAEPSTYAEGNATYALGYKTAPTVSAPAAGSPSGRAVTISAITDGVVSASGTAAYWSLLDTSNSRLLAAGALSASQSVTIGHTFTLAAFTIGIPDPA
jgi:hypothetical protein